jgi:hypothetical protein
MKSVLEIRRPRGKMRTNWRRGFLRAWAVLALAWIGFFGWKEYSNRPYVSWATPTEIRVEKDCWNLFAKWPDGQPMGGWDDVSDEFDIPENVTENKKNHAWSADNIAERNRWRGYVRAKAQECAAATPIGNQFLPRLYIIWSDLRNSLSLIFLPPLALLIAGYVFWRVASGFRAKA